MTNYIIVILHGIHNSSIWFLFHVFTWFLLLYSDKIIANLNGINESFLSIVNFYNKIRFRSTSRSFLDLISYNCFHYSSAAEEIERRLANLCLAVKFWRSLLDSGAGTKSSDGESTFSFSAGEQTFPFCAPSLQFT